MSSIVVKKPGIVSRLRGLFGGAKLKSASSGGDVLGAGVVNSGTAGDPFWALNQDFRPEGALTGLMLASVWNYACAAMIAGSVSSVRPIVTVDGKRRENHPLLFLLNSPTPDHGWSEWQYMRTLNLGLSGSDYLEAYHRDNDAREPVHQLWPFAEGRVRTIVQPHHAGRPVILGYHRGVKVLRKDRVIRTRFSSPDNFEQGLAPAFAAALESAGDRAAATWQRCSYDNRTMPSALITLPTDDAAKVEKFKKTFMQGWVNARNGRGVIVIGGGAKGGLGALEGSGSVDYQSLTQTAIEADYVASRNASRKVITAIWGVPDVLFSASDSTFSNLAEARLFYWQSTVMRYISPLFDSINRHLAPLYNAKSGGVVKVVPDVLTVPELLPAVKEKIALAIDMRKGLGVPLDQLTRTFDLPVEAFEGWSYPLVGPGGARFPLEIPELKRGQQMATIDLTQAQTDAITAEQAANEAEADRLAVEAERVLASMRAAPSETALPADGGEG